MLPRWRVLRWHYLSDACGEGECGRMAAQGIHTPHGQPAKHYVAQKSVVVINFQHV